MITDVALGVLGGLFLWWAIPIVFGIIVFAIIAIQE
jgi:hypothetical protein